MKVTIGKVKSRIAGTSVELKEMIDLAIQSMEKELVHMADDNKENTKEYLLLVRKYNRYYEMLEAFNK